MSVPAENNFRLIFDQFGGSFELTLTGGSFVLDTWGFGMGGPDLETPAAVTHLILSDTVLSVIMRPAAYTGFIAIGLNVTGPAPSIGVFGTISTGTVVASWEGQTGNPIPLANGLQLNIE